MHFHFKVLYISVATFSGGVHSNSQVLRIAADLGVVLWCKVSPYIKRNIICSIKENLIWTGLTFNIKGSTCFYVLKLSVDIQSLVWTFLLYVYFYICNIQNLNTDVQYGFMGNPYVVFCSSLTTFSWEVDIHFTKHIQSRYRNMQHH